MNGQNWKDLQGYATGISLINFLERYVNRREANLEKKIEEKADTSESQTCYNFENQD